MVGGVFFAPGRGMALKILTYILKFCLFLLFVLTIGEKYVIIYCKNLSLAFENGRYNSGGGY